MRRYFVPKAALFARSSNTVSFCRHRWVLAVGPTEPTARFDMGGIDPPLVNAFRRSPSDTLPVVLVTEVRDWAVFHGVPANEEAHA